MVEMVEVNLPKLSPSTKIALGLIVLLILGGLLVVFQGFILKNLALIFAVVMTGTAGFFLYKWVMSGRESNELQDRYASRVIEAKNTLHLAPIGAEAVFFNPNPKNKREDYEGDRYAGRLVGFSQITSLGDVQTFKEVWLPRYKKLIGKDREKADYIMKTLKGYLDSNPTYYVIVRQFEDHARNIVESGGLYSEDEVTIEKYSGKLILHGENTERTYHGFFETLVTPYRGGQENQVKKWAHELHGIVEGEISKTNVIFQQAGRNVNRAVGINDDFAKQKQLIDLYDSLRLPGQDNVINQG